MVIGKDAVLQHRVVFQPQSNLPAPFGGLNTRDDRGSMPIQDALILTNWIPSNNNAVTIRDGYSAWETDFTGQVNTLMTYKSGLSDEMIACATTKWHSMPNTALAGSTELETGLTNANWQYVNFNSFLLAVNGADQPRNYNGTTVASTSFSGDITTDSKETSVDGIHVHRNRVYLWDSSTSDFYYGATNAISGAFTKFPLSRVSQTGGNLLIVNTISFDTGAGMDDQLAFILDTGEVLIYAGGDPGDASNWLLKGRYTIPAPLSIRSSVQFGGDIKVITRADVISLLQFILAEGKQEKFSKLTGALRDESKLHSSKFGWQAVYHASADLLVYNVPQVDNSTYSQYVSNSNTGASSKFEGYDGKCWVVWKNELYFGEDGAVYKALDSLDDNGAAISSVAQQAFTTMEVQQDKNFITYDMLVASDGTLDISHSLAVNYGDVNTSQPNTTVTSGAEWDIASWDTSDWGGSDSNVREVSFSLGNTGLSASSKISISIKGQTVNWYKSSYSYAPMVAR